MNPSPLQLERYFFSKIQIDAHLDGDPKVANIMDSEVETGQALENSRRFQVVLRLKLRAPEKRQTTYTGEFHAVGFFHVVDDWPEKALSQLVETNGAALLYGAIRETLCNLTSRGPWPAITLKSVTFIKPAPPAVPVKLPAKARAIGKLVAK